MNNKDSVQKVKVNTKTLEPYQLVSKVIDRYYSKLSKDDVKFYDTMWDNLPKLENSINALPIVDVSGSMSGLPMEVAISLGIYLAENNQSKYHNHFYTFSSDPELIELKEGAGLTRNVNLMEDTDWGMSTDLGKVFNEILNTALKHNYSNKDIPEMLVILSDMNFDEIGDGWISSSIKHDDTFFEKVRAKYESRGYKLPFIVFWNIDGNAYGNDGAHPVVHTDKNVCEVSGFSKNIYKTIMDLDLDDLENYTPEKVLLETLNSERYKDVEKLFE